MKQFLGQAEWIWGQTDPGDTDNLPCLPELMLRAPREAGGCSALHGVHPCSNGLGALEHHYDSRAIGLFNMQLQKQQKSQEKPAGAHHLQ